ncbi:MAG: hypothetical protein H6893_09395 [Brucellaceae bacterium]|nr:hypothetical protein [Brucellaceae bacterium]
MTRPSTSPATGASSPGTASARPVKGRDDPGRERFGLGHVLVDDQQFPDAALGERVGDRRPGTACAELEDAVAFRLRHPAPEGPEAPQVCVSRLRRSVRANTTVLTAPTARAAGDSFVEMADHSTL